MSIEKFRGENYFLSNMYPLDNWIDTENGLSVPTSEHAFQSARFVDDLPHEMVALTEDGIQAKILAHQLLDQGAIEKPDWPFIKIGIMHGVVTKKFKLNPDIAEKLATTGEQELVEGNNWGDHYWGVDPVGSRNGQNHLGRILMRVRADLQVEAR